MGKCSSACFKTFCEEWRIRYPGLDVFVFGDQLGTHVQYDLTKSALAMGVHMWPLPSNTSHFLQTLDHLVFATFKKMIAKETYAAVVCATFSGQDLDKILFGIVLDIELSAFTPRIIRAAFRNTGLHPWNPAMIVKLAQENAGVIERSKNRQFPPNNMFMFLFSNKNI